MYCIDNWCSDFHKSWRMNRHDTSSVNLKKVCYNSDLYWFDTVSYFWILLNIQLQKTKNPKNIAKLDILQETKPKNTENIRNLLFFIKVLLVFLFIVIYTKDEKLTFTKRRTFSTKCKTTLLKVMTLLKNYSFKNTFEIKYTNISRRGLST